MKLNFKKMFAILLSIMLIVCALPNSMVMAESTGNVAKIGDTEYATLAEALDVAQDGDTIVLLQDITSPIYGIGGGLNIKKAITLDLGGKTITDGWIKTEKNVTVQNGKLVNTTQSYPLVAKYGSTLTVTNLQIEDSKSQYAIDVQENCSLIFNNSSLVLKSIVLTSSTRDIYAIRGGKNSSIIINSGTINATATATGKRAYGIYCSNDNANVTVNGGNITTSGSGYNYAINTYGDITINGGNIVTGADGNGNYNYALYSNSDITVSGGSITTNGNFGYAIYAQGTEQTVTITGGEFKSKTETNLIKAGYSTKLTATIENGEFTGYNETLLSGGSSVSNVSVSGGTFDALNESYIEEGATVIVAGKTYTKTEGTVTEVFVPAKVNGVGYATFAEALVAANGMTGDVVVEINGKVEYTDATPNLTGAYDSITFIGNTEDAEISITRNGSNGYISGVGDDCTVNFENLILSKPAGFYANDAGYMNMAFSVYRVGEVNYTNCTFPNGACAAGCPTTYTECTFEKSHEKYALWAYGTEVAIDKCIFDDDRGIKMYAEGLTKTTELTVTKSDFSKLTGKPAIVATCGKSITLSGNTYSAKGVLELEDNGSSNGIKIDSTDTVTCISDNYPNGCGLIVDGKIYRSVAEAAAVATSGSTVTLLHNSTETVEFVEGVVLNKNGFTADSVTVKAPASVAQVGDVEYATLDEAIAAANNGDIIKLISDITLTDTVVFPAGLTVTLDLGEYTISQTKECTESYSMIKNNGNLTITGNGKISFKDTGAGDPEFHWGAYTLSNHGTLVVESGIIENLSEQNTPGNVVHMYCAIQQGWGAVSTTINGGTISTPTYRSVRSNCGALIINGGNFEGQVWVQPNQGDATIKITGGTFAPKGGDGSSVFLTNVGENNTIAAAEISGGTFTTKVGSSNAATLPMTVTGGTFAVAIPENWCEEGFAPVENGDGTFGVAATPKGSGTQADPYLINNKEELLWFQAKVDEQSSDGTSQFAGVYFKLTADIDLAGINWNPIGSMSGDHGSFKGVFDGDGHTIYNLYVDQAGNGLGLFAYTAGNAVIKNLNLVNVTVKSTNNSNYLGGVVGNAYASTKIENVHVSGDILISGCGYIGAIAGHGYVVMDNVSVVGNEGSLITSTFWCAGGILGYGGEGTTNIANAHVEGLTITSAAGGLGAIIGMAEDNEGTQPISGSNLSAKNVEIKTYVGGYGTAYEDYAMGYLYGGNPTSKLTGNLTVDNVVVETASGNSASVNDAVASINGVIYFNLEAAFNAAQDGDTIVLLRDIEVVSNKADAAKGVFNIADGVNLVFDLNGHTINATDNSTGNFILIYNYGTLTVKGGNINLTATNNREWNAQSTIILNRGGVLTIESGKFIHNGGTDMAITVDNSGNSYGDAYLYINGGEIRSTYTAIRMRMADPTLNGNPGNGLVYLEITDGTIYGGSRGVWGQITNNSALDLGALTITGGTVEGGNQAINMSADGNNNMSVEISGNAIVNGVIKGDAADYAITGGTFTAPIAQDFCADGFIPKDNGDGTYGVKVGKYVAEVDGIGYETFEEALAAAKEGDTIKLVADVYEPTMTLVLPVGVSLDLQTYKLTVLYLVGFNGSHILGATYKTDGSAYGQLVVAKDRVILPSEAYKDTINSVDYYVLPVWDPNDNCFVFGRYFVNESDKNHGFFIDEENNELKYIFKHMGSSTVNNTLFADGASDNAVTFLVKITWTDALGNEVSQDYKYSDAMVGTAMTTNYDFAITFQGYKECTDIVVTAMFVSSTGVVVAGETHVVNAQI